MKDKQDFFGNYYGAQIREIVDLVLIVSNSQFWHNSYPGLPASVTADLIRYKIEFIPDRKVYTFNTTLTANNTNQTNDNLFDPDHLSCFKLTEIFVETEKFILTIHPKTSCLKINGNVLNREALSYWSWSLISKETTERVDYPINISNDPGFNEPLEAKMVSTMDLSSTAQAYQVKKDQHRQLIKTLSDQAEKTRALKVLVHRLFDFVTMVPKFSHLKEIEILAFLEAMINEGKIEASEIDMGNPNFNYKFFHLLGKFEF
jgi:hypothetical protein